MTIIDKLWNKTLKWAYKNGYDRADTVVLGQFDAELYDYFREEVGLSMTQASNLVHEILTNWE